MLFEVLRASQSCATAAILSAALGGCVQTGWQTAGGPVGLSSANQMMDLEESDRVNRFQRLAAMAGVAPPLVDQASVPAGAVPGAVRPVPVIRVVFDEGVFFDPGSDTPRPESAAALAIIAQNMQRDVPDVRLTLLGHTDATGSEQANYQLSQRRALAVFRRLLADGVNPAQLGTVAIGAAQPIAPNSTAAGRARNRRVEFLISASENANLALVEQRPVNPSYLKLAGSAPAIHTARHAVAFMKPAYTGPVDFSEAPADKRQVALSTVRTITAGSASDAEDTGSPVSRASALVR